MRSRGLWPYRIVLGVSFALNLALVDRDVFHRPFVDSLIYGLLAVNFPFLFLMLWGAKVEQERRARAQQQPSNLDPGARIVGDAPGANSAVTPAGMPTPARSP